MHVQKADFDKCKIIRQTFSPFFNTPAKLQSQMFFIPSPDMSNALSQFCQSRVYLMSLRCLIGIRIDHIHSSGSHLMQPVPNRCPCTDNNFIAAPALFSGQDESHSQYFLQLTEILFRSILFFIIGMITFTQF